MNDSFRTNVFVCYRPETIACACIYLAARQLQIALPSNPPWYGLFQADELEIQDICFSILKLYTRPKPNPDKLEQIVNDIKKVHVEARLKARGTIASNNATPNSGSRPATPSKVDSPMSAQLRRIKTEDDRKSEHSFGKDLPKKRSHSPDSRDSSRSRSRSRSARSSHSGSRSPAPKKRHDRFRTPPKYKERERTKHKYSQDNRYSRSDKLHDKYMDKYSVNNDRNDKYYYDETRYSKKDKLSSRDRDYYDTKDYKYSSKKGPSPIKYARSRSRSYSPDPKSKKKYKDKHRSRSRSRSYEKYESKRKSKKHANGHRRSRSRDRYKKSA